MNFSRLEAAVYGCGCAAALAVLTATFGISQELPSTMVNLNDTVCVDADEVQGLRIITTSANANSRTLYRLELFLKLRDEPVWLESSTNRDELVTKLTAYSARISLAKTGKR